MTSATSCSASLDPCAVCGSQLTRCRTCLRLQTESDLEGSAMSGPKPRGQREEHSAVAAAAGQRKDASRLRTAFY